MSYITKDYHCHRCDEDNHDVFHARDEVQVCEVCNEELTWIPSPTANHEWGQSRFFKGLDRTFDSRSDLKLYLKDNGLQQSPSSEKHHGARNESHLGLGRLYSHSKA